MKDSGCQHRVSYGYDFGISIDDADWWLV